MYEATQPNKLQEIGNTVFVAESTQTPLTALLKRGPRPKQMLSEWPVKKYDDVAFAGTLDGDDITTFSKTDRTKIQGYGMWMRSPGWMVSKLAALTRSAGITSEDAEQMASDGVKLALMIEKQIGSDSDTQAESGVNPYRSRGMLSWLAASAQGVLPVPANYRPASACVYTSALNSFRPSSLEAMLAAASDQKNGPVDLLFPCGRLLKRQMSTWAQRDPDAEADEASALVSYGIDVEARKVLESVDFFEFDTGKIKALTHWHLMCTEGTGARSDYSARSGVGIDLRMWDLAFMQEVTNWEEPRKSGGRRGYHDAVYVLRCRMPAGQIMVKTNTDS
jgi:hypothetical protein